MLIFEMILLGIALSMDAAAVSMGDGLNEPKMHFKKALLIALFFGLFQSIMPIIGFFLGIGFSNFISKIAPWVALIILSFLGINMIYETIKGEKEENKKSLTIKVLFFQSIATSIDALAVGVTFIALGMQFHNIESINYNLWFSVFIIGILTFLISTISIYIGKKFGMLLSNKATLIGGLILLGIGLKIFIQGVFF